MLLSKYCHVFQREDISALVNSLTLEVVYVLTKDLSIFREKLNLLEITEKDELYQVLVSQGMLVENWEADDFAFSKMQGQLRSEISLELLYLLVSDGCNLRCKYCFEETPSLAEPFKSTLMNKETVIKALDLFAMKTKHHGNPEKKKVIHIYGGEPMINRRAVYQAVSYTHELKVCGKLPYNCQLAIVTNGILLNEEDAKLFSKHNVTVGLSIDGPATITDFYRIPKRHDVHVTERITAAFQMLKFNEVSVGLSVTLTPRAIEHFDEFLTFFTEGIFREADGVSIKLLHITPNLELPDDYYRSAVECQINAFKRFREIGLYEERMMRRVRAFVDQEPMYSDCGVVGRQFVIAPDGRIGVCQDFVKPRTYFPSSVYDKENHDLLEKLFVGWRERSPFFMPQCKDCVAIGICGGGCPASAELKTGSRYNLDERACHHSKQVLEWLVWDAYENLNEPN